MGTTNIPTQVLVDKTCRIRAPILRLLARKLVVLDINGSALVPFVILELLSCISLLDIIDIELRQIHLDIFLELVTAMQWSSALLFADVVVIILAVFSVDGARAKIASLQWFEHCATGRQRVYIGGLILVDALLIVVWLASTQLELTAFTALLPKPIRLRFNSPKIVPLRLIIVHLL